MFEKILVPLDGSELAEAILPHLEAVDDRHQAEVILLRVLPAKGVHPQTAAKQRHEAEDYLAGVEQRLLEEGMRARYTIRHGSDAAEEIVDYADVNSVDLIAMCTHGLSRINRRLFGSIASKVLQGASKPMLLVTSPGARISRP